MTSASLTSLYTDIIFEHDKRPLHAGLREPFEGEVHHVNPTCGDEITLRLHLTGPVDDPVIEDVSYDAQGCAMSRASASMMADLLRGQSVERAAEISDSFELSMASRGKDAGDEELIGDAVALLGASKFPGRVKCVVMPWKAYRAALVESLAALGAAEA
ncbi:Fe-S cluster assembly sulfur transfer protein SufU [Brachybacterium nesterenkovii]|uniref:Putative iron-sulfur cluster assembly scaffold protein for SUF system, SufE2 n=1 Tax=Brachybacterium nesterenkovii TaxID=47847 RepID=A0A1X6WT84_9MICO|nr:SUF system NifU family Fe-S cluster assembly protein [Brachybacterium nesterenkovii]SLM88201.1 Putative iron-sulfur cluster assembly scaffold protein for SUF system, SufE2 [Brachybacterium nesterenkovii]